MEKLSFIHLSGPRRGEVDVVRRMPATIGSDPGVEVSVPGVAPRHALVDRHNGNVVLLDAGSGHDTFLAGETVREAVLRDGDVLELGKDGPRLRFHHEGAPHASAHHWAGTEAALRTSRAFRLVMVVVLLGGVVLLAWTWRVQGEVARLQEAVRAAERERRGFQDRVEDERRRAESERLSLQAQIEASRARQEELTRKLNEATSGEVQRLTDELKKARERLVALEDERAVGERIIRNYGAGVGLVQGSYAFYDDKGRPLRQRVDAAGNTIKEADGSVSLSAEGTGPIYTDDYYGTGFLVDPKGLVLTNRHVAEPWVKDAVAQALAKEGFHARFARFRAFFPGFPEEFKLEVYRRSDTVDLALLKADLKGRKIPTLPLDTMGRGAVAGQPVVVVGYPTGLEAILAKADSSVVQDILAAHGTNSGSVTEALARRGLIRPSTTQGHIGDITRTDIVFDAPTTQGGSGGPVFNRSGQVIAVEYAVLQKFGGNAFGLPIRHAVALLKEPKKR